MVRIACLFVALLVVGCGVNSVTPDEIGQIKEGNVLIWRYRKSGDGKSWMYADKVVKRDGDKITYVTSKKEATSKLSDAINEMDTREMTTTIPDLQKFATEQGAEKKVIIEIR